MSIVSQVETLSQDPQGLQVLLEIQVHLACLDLKETEDTREGQGSWAQLEYQDLRVSLDSLERRVTQAMHSLFRV